MGKEEAGKLEEWGKEVMQNREKVEKTIKTVQRDQKGLEKDLGSIDSQQKELHELLETIWKQYEQNNPQGMAGPDAGPRKEMTQAQETNLALDSPCQSIVELIT